MKKIFALLLVLTMTMSLFAACGKKTEAPPADPTTETVTDESADTQPTETETADTQPADSGDASEMSALSILETIWGKYADEEKFAIMGGNMENAVMDAPGAYDLQYSENLTYNLLVPAEQIPNVDQVASMIHAMNANTFTCGAFHVAEGVSAEDFATAMNEAIAGNMWMCGFPERQVIVSLEGGYVVIAFGVNDAMTPFFTHLQEAYPEATVLFDEPIA